MAKRDVDAVIHGNPASAAHRIDPSELAELSKQMPNVDPAQLQDGAVAVYKDGKWQVVVAADVTAVTDFDKLAKEGEGGLFHNRSQEATGAPYDLENFAVWNLPMSETHAVQIAVHAQTGRMYFRRTIAGPTKWKEWVAILTGDQSRMAVPVDNVTHVAPGQVFEDNKLRACGWADGVLDASNGPKLAGQWMALGASGDQDGGDAAAKHATMFVKVSA
jgi:hypothetical protein